MATDDDKTIPGISRPQPDSVRGPFFDAPRERLCFCNEVDGGTVIAACREHDCRSVAEVGLLTKAGTGCGSCRNSIGLIIKKLTGSWPQDL